MLAIRPAIESGRELTMKNRRFTLANLVVCAVAALAAGYLAWFVNDPYRHEMKPVYAVIAAGEQGWADEAAKMVHRMIAKSSDQHALADRLLDESDGSLVAEGMILAIRSNHPDARTIVQDHLGDKRWNWALANNDDLAKELLLYLDGKPISSWVQAWLKESARAMDSHADGMSAM